MAGDHSTLLKFLVDTPKVTMAENEPDLSAIESEAPRLQQLRSGTESTIDKLEWENTSGNNASDAKMKTLEEKDALTNKNADAPKPPEDKDNDIKEDVDKTAAAEKGNDPSVSPDKQEHTTSEETAAASKDKFVYSPVITVTKQESTLTKGELKLQKVVVSEDISDESGIINTTLRVTEARGPREGSTHTRSEVFAVSKTFDEVRPSGGNDKENTEGADQKDPKKIQTKIPRLRLKQVVERVRRQQQQKRRAQEPQPSSEQKVHLSIPKPKDIKKTNNTKTDWIQDKKEQEIESPKYDDEFDKIYEEILENEASNNVPSPEKITNPIKLESKFEEIIHAYDENNVQPISVEKTKSKIPLLKRKSEQEIEIPPPSNRKHSLKRSNTEDFKGKIPVAIVKEKSLKSNVETVRSENTSTTKTYESTTSIKTDVSSIKRSESHGGASTTVIKTITTQTSMEMNELGKTASTENVVLKSESTNNSYMKDTTRCKIPVAFNSKERIESNIHTANLNKHSTRVNVIETISKKITPEKTDKVIDKKVEQSDSTNVVAHNVKSSTVVLQSEKIFKQDFSHITGTTKINNETKVETEHTTSLLQENKTSQTEDSKNVNQHTQIETKNLICDMPTIPSTLTKFEKLTNTTKTEVTSENLANSKTGQYDIISSNANKGFRLSGNKNDFKVIESKDNLTNIQSFAKLINTTKKGISSEILSNPKTGDIIIPFNVTESTDNLSTIQGSKRAIDTSVNVITYHSKTTDEGELKSQNENEKNNFTKEKSNATAKNNIDISKTITENNQSTTSASIKQGFNETNEEQKTTDSTTVIPSTVYLSNDIQDYKKKNETFNNKPQDKVVNNLKTNSEKVDYQVISHQSKEIKIESEKSQTINKLELTLESPTKTIINEINTIKEATTNPQTIAPHFGILHQKDVLSSQKQIDEKLNISAVQVMSIKEPSESIAKIPDKVTKQIIESVKKTSESKQEKNSNLEDPSVINTNIEETEEEDIIMLKGKVNRVIRRLDSKDQKTVKKEIDDVPKEVSVISKIAIFEKTELTDTLPKTNELKDPAAIHEIDIVHDKPIIVDEVLKTDVNQNLVNYTEKTVPSENQPAEYAVNKAKNTNDVEVKKGSTTDNKSGLKTKIYKIEGNKIRRTILNAVGDNNEVFVKKDDEASSLEVWKEYRRKKELDSDKRRARSLAELDLGDAVRGRVRQLVQRMSSVEAGGARGRARVEGSERPRVGSVSQRIALYEVKMTAARSWESGVTSSCLGEQRKLTPARGDELPSRQQTRPITVESTSIDQEDMRRRLEELRSAKAKYGQLGDVSYVELSDGGRMPVLALGTAIMEPGLVEPVVSAALDLGFRAIDSAFVYGNEREVGRAIRSKIQDGTVSRSELFIINKLWSTFHRRDLVEKACRQSLEAMGLDYFDLYLIHNPMSLKEGPNPMPKIANVLQYSEHDYLEAWFGIEGLVKSGLVRRGGLSNFNSLQVERVVEKGRIKPAVNQVECHPYLNQLRLEEFCLSRNIKLNCYGVLGSKGTPAEYTSGLPPVIDDPLVKVMAAGLGITPAQLLISYQLQQGRSVVVKCSSAAHLAETRAAPARLGAAHVAALHALHRNKRNFTFIGMGDTHRNYPFRIAF